VAASVVSVRTDVLKLRRGMREPSLALVVMERVEQPMHA
jgi:hypothetical protein